MYRDLVSGKIWNGIEVVTDLANDIPLHAKNKDHALQGEFVGCRECHIQPDWLLIYSKESDGELIY